jgi:hypothetical protein
MKIKTPNYSTNSSEPGNTIQINQGALKLKDACQYLGGISPTSVRRLIKRRLLTPNRTLRHLLIPVRELKRFLESRQQ